MENIFEKITSKIKYKSYNLYPYQIKLKEEVYNRFSNENNNRSILLQMPTASGKTITFCSIIDDCINISNLSHDTFDCLIVVHREELLDQVANTLTNLGHYVGKITRNRNKIDIAKPIQIAMIGSLGGAELNDDDKKRFKLIIIDEAHHALAPTYEQLYLEYPNAKILGVTATPMRMTGEPLNDIFDELIVGPSIRELIESEVKYLAKPNYLVPSNPISLSGIRIDNGDYNNSELLALLNKKDIIKTNIIDSYNKYVKGKQGLVFAINKEHCIQLKEAFTNNGIDAEYLVSDPDDPNTSKRIEIVENFRNGKLKILINRDIFTEGFDCPNAEFVILARPTKSFVVYMQQIGRVLRKKKNNQDGFIIDTVNAFNEHPNFLEDINWQSYFEGTTVENSNAVVEERNRTRNINYDFYEGDDNLKFLDFEFNFKTNIEENSFNFNIIDFLEFKIKDIFTNIIGFGYHNEEIILDALRVLDNESIEITEGNFNLYDDIKQEISNHQISITSLQEKIQIEKKYNLTNEQISKIKETQNSLLSLGFSINKIPGMISENPNFSDLSIDLIENITNNNLSNNKDSEFEINELTNKIEQLILKIEKIKKSSNEGKRYVEDNFQIFEITENNPEIKDIDYIETQDKKFDWDLVSKMSIKYFILDKNLLTSKQRQYLNDLILSSDKDFNNRINTLKDSPEIIANNIEGFGISKVIEIRDVITSQIKQYISKEHYNFIKVGRLLNITDDDLLTLFNEDYHAFNLLDILLSKYYNLNKQNKIYYNFLFNKVGSYNDISTILTIPQGTLRPTLSRLRKLFSDFFNEFSNVYFDKLKTALTNDEVLIYDRTINIYMINQEQLLLFNQENEINISIFIIDALFENKIKDFSALSNLFQGTTYCLQNGFWISKSINKDDLKEHISSIVKSYDKNANKVMTGLEVQLYDILYYILNKEGIEFDYSNSDRKISLNIKETRTSKKRLIINIFNENGQNGLTIPQINSIIMENNLDFHRDLEEKARLKNITDIVSRGNGDFYIFGLDGRNNVYKLVEN